MECNFWPKKVCSFEWVHKKKESWKSVIEVSVLGNYKIKGKLNPINKQMEGKLKLKGKSMT